LQKAEHDGRRDPPADSAGEGEQATIEIHRR